MIEIYLLYYLFCFASFHLILMYELNMSLEEPFLMNCWLLRLFLFLVGFLFF